MTNAAPVVDLEPADLGVGVDPYTQLAAARDAGPVVRSPSGFVLVVGHDAVVDVLRHPAAGSGAIGRRYVDALPPGAARDELSHRINFLDPPDHPRVRGLVSKVFTPRRIAELRPFVERTAADLLDDLAATTGPVDVQARFAHQLPSLVISEMLGVPIDLRDRLTTLSDDVTPLLGVQLDPDERATAIAAAEEMHGVLGELLEARRCAPGADLLSALVEAEEDGERLSRAELLSLAATLYSAGHRTTRDLTTGGLSVLLTLPDLTTAARDGSLAPAHVVSEMLRYETPTLYVARIPTEPFEIAGVEVTPTDPVLVVLASANRDPTAYPDPDVFDPTRWDLTPPPPTPVSFAFGAHYCLGASLARLEAEVMVTSFLERFPDATPVGDALRWRQRGPFRSLDGLAVRLT